MGDTSMATTARHEELVPRFKLKRVLNQDQGGRRVALHGTIDEQEALLIVERAPFATDEGYLGRLPELMVRIRGLGMNDVYSWGMGRTGDDGTSSDNTNNTNTNTDNDSNKNSNDSDSISGTDFSADVKINLIYPCTEAHVAKYSRQGVRLVTETPEVYRDKVRPFMERRRAGGRLNWVYNILEGTKEAGDVLYRNFPPKGLGPNDNGNNDNGGNGNDDKDNEGFLLLPDLNWDRRTLEALHLLALVERRDMWSLRDLRKRHIPWLEHMRARLIAATVATYHPSIQPDQLKLYVHYQPTYYHFHVHIVHVALEAGATQATGKAVGLDSIIETLRVMAGGDDDAGMDGLTMTYTLGEASDLWNEVFRSGV